MLWRLLRKFLRPHVVPLAVVVCLSTVGTTTSLFLPNLNGHIIDRGVAFGDTGYVLRTGAIMLAIAAFQIGCSIASVYWGARVGSAFGRDLRAAIFHQVGRLSAREVGRIGAPSLITRTTNDVQQVQMLVLVSVTMMIAAPIMFVGGIVMALQDDLSLSRLLLVCVPALGGSMGFILARMIRRFRAMQPKIDTVNRILREQITGMRVVRAFVREPAETGRFEGANGELTSIALGVGNLQVLMLPAVMLIFNLSTVAALWFGSRRVSSGSLEIGALIAYLAYLMQILVAVMMTTFMSIMVPRAAVCAERITEVLELEPKVAPG
jgi:ATP-binding cassette subfamily B protein